MIERLYTLGSEELAEIFPAAAACQPDRLRRPAMLFARAGSGAAPR
jgi:hypothetical protein